MAGVAYACGVHPGTRLREFRARAGLSQREAAELAGVSLAGLRDLEQGRVSAPRETTLRKLAIALRLSETEAWGLRSRTPLGTPGTPRLWLAVLGPLLARVNGSEVDPGSAVQRMLLGLLALAPNQIVSRQRLLARLAAAGRLATEGALAARVSRLRRRLDSADRPHPPALVAHDGGYELVVTEDQLDLLAFQSSVRQARRAVAAADPDSAWRHYVRAAPLWRGAPLSGLGLLADDPAVVKLVRQWPAVAVEFATVGIDLGRYAEVVPVLRRVAAEDPLHEVVHARLMVALAGVGRQAEALEVFEALRQRLLRDLGTGPGPELREAHRRVLRQQVSGPAGGPLRARYGLPPGSPDIVGREQELDRVWPDAVPGGAAKILSVVGMPGVGKSQFALRLAHALVADGHYRDQQLYADLGEAGADEAAVLASFLQRLGVPAGDAVAEPAAAAATYRRLVGAAPTLVVLDNLTEGQPIARLLPGTPGSLTVLTSRHRLDLPGTVTLHLAEFRTSEGIRLFRRTLGEDRVQAEPADAARVVRLCAGLPLAVGIVAIQMQARPQWRFAEVAAWLAAPGRRIRELAVGARSVVAAFRSAESALPPRHREWLRRLAGSPVREFTAAEVEVAIAASPGECRKFLDTLAARHLLTADGGRYRLHRLLRDYLHALPTGASARLEGDW